MKNIKNRHNLYKEYETEIPREKNIICHRTDDHRVEKVIDQHRRSASGKISKKRVLIGYVASPTTMYPNDNYAKYYPEEWKKLTGKNVKNYETVVIGLKAVLREIVTKSGLDDTLRGVYGTQDTNFMYDRTMYALLTNDYSAQHFERIMSNHAIFSSRLHSDSYFSNKIRQFTESKRDEFTVKWIEYNQSIYKGGNLLGDATNFATSAFNISHAQGKSKQQLDHGEEIVGSNLLYDLLAGPLSLDIYPGDVVDYKALEYSLLRYNTIGTIDFHKIILDRAYCTIIIIEYLNKLNLPYEIMLDSNILAMQSLISEFRDELMLNSGNYWLEDTNLLGINKYTQIFSNSDYCDNVSLYFDPYKYGNRARNFFKKLNKECKSVKEELNSNNDVIIKKEFADLIKIVDENGKKNIMIDRCALTQKLNEFGFFGIINHIVDEKPEKVLYDYKTKAMIEQCFDQVKNGLGLYALRVHDDEALQGKIQLILVTLIIYDKIYRAAKSVGKTVPEIIDELEKVKAQYINGAYSFIDITKDFMKDFLAYLDADISTFAQEAQYYNDSINHYVRFPRRRRPGPRPTKSKGKRQVADPEKAKQREEAKAKREARRQYDPDGKPLPLPRGPIPDPEKAEQREKAKAKREARRQYDADGKPLPLPPGRIPKKKK